MPDMSKVRADDHDNFSTPLEASRRAAMHIKPGRYGFYRVASGPTALIRCDTCKKAIHGTHTILDGTLYCNYCLVNR